MAFINGLYEMYSGYLTMVLDWLRRLANSNYGAFIIYFFTFINIVFAVYELVSFIVFLVPHIHVGLKHANNTFVESTYSNNFTNWGTSSSDSDEFSYDSSTSSKKYSYKNSFSSSGTSDSEVLDEIDYESY